jgi:hypothetical protein
MGAQQERRILSQYAGVGVDDVARLENVAPYEVRALRARRGRSVAGLRGPRAHDAHEPQPSPMTVLRPMLRRRRRAPATVAPTSEPLPVSPPPAYADSALGRQIAAAQAEFAARGRP